MPGVSNTSEPEPLSGSLESVLDKLLGEAIVGSKIGTAFMSEVGVSDTAELAQLIQLAQRIGFTALDIKTKEDFIAWAKKIPLFFITIVFSLIYRV